MSYEDGQAALNLEMPPRVPRFEPSAAHYHFQLVREVTGMNVGPKSSIEERNRAARAFMEAWDYGINFGALISYNELGEKFTRMGHAEYAEEGRDFDGRIESLFESPEQVLEFDPWQFYGEKDHDELVRRFNEHYHERCELYPNTVNTTGIYISLMSGMIAVFGWDLLLLAAGTDPEGFGEVLNRWAGWMQQYYNAAADSIAPVIYSHDDMVWTEGAFINPEWYRKYVFPNIRRYWAPLREAGKHIIFICDGDYTEFVEDIAACGNTGFWFEIFTDLEYICRQYGQTHAIIGNADSRVLTFGDRDAIREEVERCMNLGKDCPGYFMCCSGHIPPNVPVESALYYNEFYMKLRDR
ncbi:MAG: uroporphyrinogen decarboxylase family protein [Candidatus Brocadiia bacterium]